jgi:polyferredoxin
LWGVSHRAPFLVEVLRDRNALYRLGQDGAVDNAYTVKIVNKTDHPVQYALALRGAPAGALLRGLPARIDAPAGEVIAVPLMVTAPEGTSGRSSLSLTVTSSDGVTRKVDSSFFGPALPP